jgi:glutamate-1-semialdehyde 2,1-aminomutase
VAASVNRAGSLLTLFLAEGEIASALDLGRVSQARYAAYFHSMLEQGVALPPSHLEALFLSTAHTATDLERTLAAAAGALGAAARCEP